MSSEFQIARLGSGGVMGMRAVNLLFRDAFEDPEHYDSAPPTDAYLETLLADPNFVALTASIDGMIVGGLCAYVLRKFEQERSEIYIYDLAVASDVRRRGVATALIHALMPIARESGAWVIYVQADYGDDPAIALYTSLGAREDVLHFDIEVR